MPNITAAEILKMYGKWIGSTEFIQLVSKKLNISERMAYIEIKKACHDKKNPIMKITLPNRAVLYGLKEFGPVTLAKNETNRIAELVKAFKELGLV